MKVETQSINFNADQELINFIQKRMDKLDLFYDKIIKACKPMFCFNVGVKGKLVFSNL